MARNDGPRPARPSSIPPIPPIAPLPAMPELPAMPDLFDGPPAGSYEALRVRMETLQASIAQAVVNRFGISAEEFAGRGATFARAIERFNAAFDRVNKAAADSTLALEVATGSLRHLVLRLEAMQEGRPVPQFDTIRADTERALISAYGKDRADEILRGWERALAEAEK